MIHSGPRNAFRGSARILLALVLLVLLKTNSIAQDSDAPQPQVPSAIPLSSSSGTSKPQKAFHDRSISDISAVGNRDVGCNSGLGSRYSLQEQIEMGRSYARNVEATSTLIADPAVSEYVDRIGQRLVRNSDAQVRFTFKIIASDNVNAFSLPGGFVFLNSGLIRAADNEAALAGVLAHEVAHVAACHAAQELARQESASVDSMPMIFRLASRRMAINTVYLKPVRIFEAEADLLAVEYLYKAGYDPHALPLFFEKIKDNHQCGAKARAFESDSRMAERIKRTRNQISTLLPSTPGSTVDTAEFQQIRKRLSEPGSDQRLARPDR